IEGLLDPTQPLTAVRLSALSDIDDRERAQLRATLGRTPLDRRLRLAHQLVDMGEDEPTLNFEGVFTLLLDDEDPEIRRLAIEGLWEYEDRSIIGPLLRLFSGDPDPDVRAMAALS